MQQVTLAGTATRTTRLGFGTAGLMRVAGARQRERLIAAAWDAGIRHYDTAPIYGLGESERLLGRVLGGRAGAFTVTTKFGLEVGPLSARLRPLQGMGRALLRALPALRTVARRRAAAFYERPPLTAAAAVASLHRSLAALRLQQVTCFLAHDCAPAQLRDDALYDALRGLRDKGLITAYGTATDRERTLQLLESHEHYCPVVQFDQNLHEGTPAAVGIARGVITHGVLSGGFARLRASEALRRRWETDLDLDLAGTGAQAALFLRAALAQNPGGIVLFESTSEINIARNAEAASVPLEPERLHTLQRLAAALEASDPAPQPK